MKPAEFGKVLHDANTYESEEMMQISMKPAEFKKMVKQSKQVNTMQETVKVKENRKKKLIYELEVNDKMRKIQKKQKMEKQVKEKQNLDVGKNLFAQIMGMGQQAKQEETPNFSKESFGVPQTEDTISEDIEQEVKEIEDEALDSLFVRDDENNGIERSTGTFGRAQQNL